MKSSLNVMPLSTFQAQGSLKNTWLKNQSNYLALEEVHRLHLIVNVDLVVCLIQRATCLPVINTLTFYHLLFGRASINTLLYSTLNISASRIFENARKHTHTCLRCPSEKMKHISKVAFFNELTKDEVALVCPRGATTIVGNLRSQCKIWVHEPPPPPSHCNPQKRWILMGIIGLVKKKSSANCKPDERFMTFYKARSSLQCRPQDMNAQRLMKQRL